MSIRLEIDHSRQESGKEKRQEQLDRWEASETNQCKYFNRFCSNFKLKKYVYDRIDCLLDINVVIYFWTTLVFKVLIREMGVKVD